ncbi:MAG: hypothetical protein HY554_00040, partial [Elusimicrobia bacterium]|nr:hypothetical protein [Elusimicrobiota bacterium]
HHLMGVPLLGHGLKAAFAAMGAFEPVNDGTGRRRWRPLQPAGSTWVRTELFRLAQGHTDDRAAVRFDNITKKINAVHNGQWFDTMDTPTRRFWELEFGADLTLPYEHKAIVTMNDFVRDNKRVRFVGLSGTAGDEFRKYLHDNQAVISGDKLASRGASNLGLELYASPAQVFELAGHTVALQAPRFLARKAAAIAEDPKSSPALAKRAGELRARMEKWLEATPADGSARAKYGELASRLREELAGAKGLGADEIGLLQAALKDSQDGLAPMILPDTITYGQMVEFLVREGYVKTHEIAGMMSDAQKLGVDYPEANVGKQMNLHSLAQGTVKVLLLDGRVGGRGLDLNFKGVRSSDKAAFKGYKHFDMLLLGPERMTQVHNIQAQGRISDGRVVRFPDGTYAERTYRLVMDVASAKKDPVFQRMINEEPRLARLRENPDVRRLALKNGRLEPDWVDIHEHIQGLEAAKAGKEITGPYRELVRRYLMEKQGEVELDQLAGSSVKERAARPDPVMRGLDGFFRR